MRTKTFAFLLAFSWTSTQSQWVVQYTHTPAQSLYALGFFNDTIGYHSGVRYDGSTYNIYKTTDGGFTYTAQNSGYTAQRFMSLAIINPDTVFISGNYGKILRTVNGGLNWTTLHSDTLKQFWGLWFVNGSTGYVAGSHGTIMKTTDSGVNWTPLPSTTVAALDGIWFLNEDTGYVAGSTIILKTTDGGATWVNKNGIFTSFETGTDVYFANEATGLYSTNAGRVVKTTDGGDTWTEVYYEPNTAVWGLSFTDPETGYGCTSNGRVVKTTNGGTTWTAQNTPLTENLYEIYFPSRLIGYVASWSGKILKTTNGGTTWVFGNDGSLPSHNALDQNFPNPFNPTTEVRFRIAGSRFVTLKIYDVLGREVATLVQEPKQRGSYAVRWDASSFPSGVYLYRLVAGEFMQTKKLLLLK